MSFCFFVTSVLHRSLFFDIFEPVLESCDPRSRPVAGENVVAMLTEVARKLGEDVSTELCKTSWPPADGRIQRLYSGPISTRMGRRYGR